MFLFIQLVFYDYIIVLRIFVWVFDIFIFTARHKITGFDMVDIQYKTNLLVDQSLTEFKLLLFL